MEINSGIYVFDSENLFAELSRLRKNLKKREYYLTDVIENMVESGKDVAAYCHSDSSEILGINTRAELAMANKILNERELKRHMAAGVTILEPSQTFIQSRVRIGRDTVIYPFSWIERETVIGKNCVIGPFAKIRAGSRIGDGARIGSFVEIVRSKIGSETFVKHLSYLGDAEIGKKVNVGAGTITANFDGRKKNKTVVGDKVFLGCNTVLIAPVRIGRCVKTGAGAVVCARQSVPAGQTIVGVPAKIIQKQRPTKRKTK